MILTEHARDYVGGFHGQRKMASRTVVPGAGVVGTVRLHHGNGGEVEIAITVFAGGSHLMNQAGGFANGAPVDSFFIGDNEARVDAGIGKRGGQQGHRFGVVVIVEHRRADVEAGAGFGGRFPQAVDQRQRFGAFHAFGVGGKGLCGDASAGAFEPRGVQRSPGRGEKLRGFIDLRVVVGLVDFDEGSDGADARVVIGGSEQDGSGEQEKQAAHAIKGTAFWRLSGREVAAAPGKGIQS